MARWVLPATRRTGLALRWTLASLCEREIARSGASGLSVAYCPLVATLTGFHFAAETKIHELGTRVAACGWTAQGENLRLFVAGVLIEEAEEFIPEGRELEPGERSDEPVVVEHPHASPEGRLVFGQRPGQFAVMANS